MFGRKIVVLMALLLTAATVIGQQPLQVSLVQLIASPEKFDGKLVSVIGFLEIGESADLYLHEEDFKHGLRLNAVWVASPSAMREQTKLLDQTYVHIIGVFSNRSENLIPAGIGKVVSWEVWSRLDHPRTERLKEIIKHDHPPM